MFQVTFSKQSLSGIKFLKSGTDQLSLIEQLSSLSNDILTGESPSVGTFLRDGKAFYQTQVR